MGGGSKKTTQTQTQTGTQSGYQSGVYNNTQTGASSGSQASRYSRTGRQVGTRRGGTTGSSVSTGTDATRSTYDWLQNPGSADINALRNFREEIDPNIAASYGRRQRNLMASFRNPLGAHTSRSIREAQERSAMGDIEQDYGAARRQAYQDAQNRSAQRLTTLAGLTAPQLVQTGTDTRRDARTDTNQDTWEDTQQLSDETGEQSGEYTGTTSGSQSGTSAGTTGGQFSSAGTTVTQQPSNKLGNILGTAMQGAGLFFSDAQLKTHIQSIPPNIIEKFRQLNGVLFKWGDKAHDLGLSGTDLGLLAQDVEKVFPEYVTTHSNGYKQVNYHALLALLIEAVKQELELHRLKE